MDGDVIASNRLSWPRGKLSNAPERGRVCSLVPRPCLLVLCARWGKDVENHGPLVRQRAPAVRHVRGRLPEVAGPDVMLDAVLDADPLALEADAPLLVGVRVHGGDG